ncbi:MAG: TIGR02466 family protein [Pseudomonadota bacterium]
MTQNPLFPFANPQNQPQNHPKGARPGGRPAGQAAQIQVRQVFPTPIALLQLPNHAAVNDALETAILEREQSTASVHHSNWGGWQSPTDFEAWGGAAGRTVLEAATQMANQLTCDRHGRPVKTTWITNAWANVNRHGQGNEFHTHPGAYWSATYYVRDGGAAEDPALGGEFEMADPRGIGPAMLAPELGFKTAGGLAAGLSETVRPVPGLLLMFPSWLSHAVRPYHGDRVRISIALNLTPRYQLSADQVL